MAILVHMGESWEKILKDHFKPVSDKQAEHLKQQRVIHEGQAQKEQENQAERAERRFIDSAVKDLTGQYDSEMLELKKSATSFKDSLSNSMSRPAIPASLRERHNIPPEMNDQDAFYLFHKTWDETFKEAHQKAKQEYREGIK